MTMLTLTAPRVVRLRSLERDGQTADAGPVLAGGMVVPWGAEFTRMGGVRFTFGADDLRLPDDLSTVKLLVQHDDDRPIGYAVEAHKADDGLHMRFALPDHPRTIEALAELDAGLRDGASVGVEVDDAVLEQAFEVWLEGEQTDPIVMAGELREVSQVTVPQFPTARVSRHRAPALVTLTRKDDPPMTTDSLPTLEQALDTFSIADAPEFLELSARLAQLEQGAPGGGHPLARFASLGEAIKAGAAGERVTLALADNVSTGGKNAGVMPPSWATDVKGIMARRRATIEAFGGARALPAAGLDTAWPYFDGDLAALVDMQGGQKTDITSVAVDIKKATAAIRTYAGGADNALQLIERSEPSFLEAWGRIMLAAYGVVTEQAFALALSGAATGSVPCETDADADAVRAALFEASDAVDDATGAPAEFVLAAGDVFVKWGALPGLHTPDYGTQNAAGTSSARTLVIDVNGLPVIKSRGLPDGEVIVSNREAAAWREDGPSFIDAVNVQKLGLDRAVYGYGVAEVYLPAGLVELVDLTP